ncbi:MAG: hypothetical protein C0599_11350 [Salinivirgaceae bacterium]|nr:MAG: hypothetical protein C0599_11350 [Salinivirgaceae bacterium]
MLKKIFKYFGLGTLTFITLFLIWYKFLFNEYDEFKNSTFFENRKHISTDGPYILYEQDSVRAIQVVEKSGDYIILDERFAKQDPTTNFTINSFSYNNPSEISFKVELMDSLFIPQAIYSKPDRIFAASDIEGNLYAFHKLLKANQIIDQKSNWTFGNGHLVLVGDFVDRGLNVTQCLWLIYKLEKQAKEQGGFVHFILGNHEILNLKGKNHHVRSKYTKLADKLGLDYTSDFYGDKSELGKWLRTKNTIEKIGDILFVHGGISQNLINLNLSIDEINQIVRNNIGLSNYSDSTSIVVHGINGPLIDRGFGHYQNAETHNIINNVKQYFNVSTIIIGHSSVDDITQAYDNSLINIDVHFPHKDSDTIRGKGLLVEFDNRFKIDDLGNKVKI